MLWSLCEVQYSNSPTLFFFPPSSLSANFPAEAPAAAGDDDDDDEKLLG